MMVSWSQLQRLKKGKVNNMQIVSVHIAEQLRVIHGANTGDVMSFADEMILDDVYEIAKIAPRQRLSIELTDHGLVISNGGDLGTIGHSLFLDCVITLMGSDGTTIEALIIVETNTHGLCEQVYVLPFSNLLPSVEYTLVKVCRDSAENRFAEIGCVSFVKGTRITIASGAMVAIEDLKVGDRVITRDRGVQVIRWIGNSTVRAVGDFAPVVIKAGALHNLNDLTVSPEHRLFIYQRSDKLGTGRAETLVRAKHLINGTDVVRLDDGFVEYYQLLFDEHQIIYAEGIAAESMLFDQRTQTVVPQDQKSNFTQHTSSYSADLEVDERTLKTNGVSLLRDATRGHR
jgi:hypothetical protein